jgi:membrane peptidoglycan carboxypeptidase
MPLVEQEPKLALGIRPMLVRVHRDLLTIHARAATWSAYYPTELTNLEKMVIVLEDRRFMRHSGIDWTSIARETSRALTFQRHGGASTIDMQFVRTATGYKDRTLTRKLYELLLSRIIQFRYSKIVILRSYLRCAFFGSHLTGADRVARELYGAWSASDLDLDQAAEVAAMLVYPRPLNPTEGWSRNVRRRAGYGKRVYVRNKQSFDKVPS